MATHVRHQEITHTIGAAGRLQIRVTDADVRLRASDDDEVRLRATFEVHAATEADADRTFGANRLLVTAEGGLLEVDEPGGRGNLGSALRRLVTGDGGVQFSIEGTAPRAAEVRIDTVSGDLVIEAMRGPQRYTTVSGDIYATDLGGSVQVTTVSGDTSLRSVEPLALRANAVSGDLSTVAPVLVEARVTTVSGDMELEGALDRSGDFRAESVSGDLAIGLVGSATVEVRGISSDVAAQVDHRLEGSADRRRLVIGDGVPRFVFSSMSGDVLVRRPRRLEPSSTAEVTGSTATSGARASEPPADEAQLEILRALERGEIDVEEATRRLAGEATDA